MRIAQIRDLDISNGENIGVSLFVQGCPFRCFNCFNSETWDLDGGYEWTEDKKNDFLNLIDRSYIKRVSFLGGEPLMKENVSDVYILIKEIKEKFPQKKIWLYSGFTFEQIFSTVETDDFNIERIYRRQIVEMCDVFIDGKYVDSLKNYQLKFRGSSNQRVIDVKKTLENKNIVLWCK